MKDDYVTVTEIAGEAVTKEQLDRVYHRYYWAGTYCRGRDLMEVACGTGQGLGYLESVGRSMVGGDYSRTILEKAAEYYKGRVPLVQFDAQTMPFASHTRDVIVIFEAIYYLRDVERFVEECRRVLRSKGMLLIVTANKDLYDFNPSPYSHDYYGVVELGNLLTRYGYNCEFYGVSPVDSMSVRQRMLRPVKKLAVKSGLMPRTMKGKKWLKRIVFGELVALPPEIRMEGYKYVDPPRLAPSVPNREYKVIYCAAQKMD